MNCQTSIKLINAYIDCEINEQEKKQLEKHLDSCEKCTLEFEELKAIVETMEDLDLKPLPIGFEEELHFKLLKANQERANEKKSLAEKIVSFSRKKSLWAIVGSVAAVAVIFISSQSLNFTPGAKTATSDESMMSVIYDSVESPQVMESTDSGMGLMIQSVGESADFTSRSFDQASSSYRTDRMVIRNAYLRIDVENYDLVFSNIINWVENSGGYVENSNTSFKTFFEDRDNLKMGYLTLRVPVEGYSLILENIKSAGRVTSENTSANDITKHYRDTASEIENLKITENRLIEILLKAEDISDVLVIENELTRVRSQINSYGQQLKNWEVLVDLTTINVELNEVESLKPVITPFDNSLIGKAKEGFIETVNSIKNALEITFVWVVAKSPILLTLLIVALGLVYKIKKK